MKIQILALALLVNASATSSHLDESNLRTRRATEHCWPCSDEVCASKLNACPATNPFVCLEGPAVSGCTAVESIWLNPSDCTSCCDLSSCPAPEPTSKPTEAPTKAPLVEPTSPPLAAAISAPTSSGGKGGKGKGKGGKGKSGRGRRLHGRKVTEHCGPCSAEVCASDMNACPETNPFLCLDGVAVSGCTAVESIWFNPVDCESCCDLSVCRTVASSTSPILGGGTTSGGKGKGKGGEGKSGGRRRRQL